MGAVLAHQWVETERRQSVGDGCEVVGGSGGVLKSIPPVVAISNVFEFISD